MPANTLPVTLHDKKPSSTNKQPLMNCKITSREKQVLYLLADDYTSKELAAYLHISVETVKSHRCNLIRKLGVKTTGGMVKRGFELGYLRI